MLTLLATDVARLEEMEPRLSLERRTRSWSRSGRTRKGAAAAGSVFDEEPGTVADMEELTVTSWRDSIAMQ